MKTTDLAGELECIEGLKVRTDVPLGRLTTFKVGGPAAVVATPETVEALQALQRIVRESGTPSYVFGNGSNLLVSDDGFDGVVIRVGNRLGGVEAVAPDRLRIGAGTHMAAGGGVAIRCGECERRVTFFHEFRHGILGR